MIFGMSEGRVSRSVELGAGSSLRWMASTAASSKRREMRVETLCRAKRRRQRRRMRNTARDRRILNAREHSIDNGSLKCYLDLMLPVMIAVQEEPTEG